ncbi:hypothetical protein CD351_12812 [Erythrobacter sp. KY5]|uniref:hypothetical protein n=1 Tax=Erythrobacter sp. KY5 TaxID=2011159 RepID=UPI000DBEF7CD|nr:hypothetical protein [Erythrobacter sp. KY5]AWW75864.1 hypothetical protein CD351_12812 [Erythrobacter sp. KY5]
MKNVFAKIGLPALGIAALTALAAPSPAIAETYQEYLSRLRDVCSAECKKPGAFQRAARQRNPGDTGDMAVIMDVVSVRRSGDKFQLLSMNFEDNPLIEVALLGAAGLNVAGRSRVGGIPGLRGGRTHPDLIIIELDEQAFHDILNVTEPLVGGEIKHASAETEGTEIVVEGGRKREVIEPSLTTLRTYFRNRRVVVRGQPRLEPVLIGARRDFRRKQVTLVVDNPDDVVLLPRYDEDGEPVFDSAE